MSLRSVSLPSIMKIARFLIYLFLFFNGTSAVALNPGDNLFSQPVVHEVRMSFSQTGYWDSLTAYYLTDQYLSGDITIDGTLYANVGVKFKGNSSYNNPSVKKPFKIDMNLFVNGQNVDGLKKLNLNNNFKDPSFLREKISCDYFRDHAMNGPRCAFTRLYINGAYWGLYNIVEEIDTDEYLESVFLTSSGNLFKGDPSGDLRWLGSAPGLYYNKYELHNNEFINDWSDLVRLIDKINNSGSAFYDSIETILNTDQFIRQWAGMNIFSSLDSYLGSGHNYYIYHNLVTDRFEWMAWDMNESFGNFKQGMTVLQLKTLSAYYVSNPPSGRPLIQNMLGTPAFRSAYENLLCTWLQSDFSNTSMDPVIDSLANMIRSAVYDDTLKVTSNQQFEDNLSIDVTLPGPGGGTVAGLKSFISMRRTALLSELGSICATLETYEASQYASILVYPNPAGEYIVLDLPSHPETEEVALYNQMLQLVGKWSCEGKTLIKTDTLPSGQYILRFSNGSARRFQIMH